MPSLAIRMRTMEVPTEIVRRNWGWPGCSLICESCFLRGLQTVPRGFSWKGPRRSVSPGCSSGMCGHTQKGSKLCAHGCVHLCVSQSHAPSLTLWGQAGLHFFFLCFFFFFFNEKRNVQSTKHNAKHLAGSSINSSYY